MRFEIPEEGTLCAAERKEGHRRGDPDVHADHTDAHAITKLARGFAALREDRRRVGEPGRSNHLDPGVEVTDVGHRRDRSEDLLFPDRHLRLDAIEDRRPDKMATRMFFDLARAPIE